ncbi:hypothetical protein H0A61_02938 [Koleobacter methoxysyntrophicus]|uniref:Uncharacterized protein n=1 Tax=Koleobacter methoxysyntrophicus TaxID=2751313 RepID=A0A8A0RSM4_9FIRM|nr:hypothetical protein [Koleobacter methoxysyntrophicus]QSQ10530.1 hypothetical protein H0A61_02938 [Koleobacter methoxysyntrophicus]
MHKLHCILVELPAEFHEENLSPTKVREAAQTARRIAMEKTKIFEGRVFSWRSEQDAGRWKDEFPGAGVVLGTTSRKSFLKLLHEWYLKPLKKAKGCIDVIKFLPREPKLTKQMLTDLWHERLTDSFVVTFKMLEALKLANGDYLFSSSFYSVPDNSAKMTKETKRRVQKNTGNFALVFSDYQF